MRLLDHSYDDPARNLALDEALLNQAEDGSDGEVLRFWMSPVPFVVLGLSQAVDEYVVREACVRDGVPVLRRCSAGGCVLQGPGSLNYSLVLRTNRPGCDTIHASYRTILEAIGSALSFLGRYAQPAGISDLAVDGKKISGNAQRRRSRYFLHHGTLLLNFDLNLCAKYLREPKDRPEYRGERSHKAFLANLRLAAPEVVHTVSEVFQAKTLMPLTTETDLLVQSLAESKYSRPEWTMRK